MERRMQELAEQVNQRLKYDAFGTYMQQVCNNYLAHIQFP
jgi:hypothetical protein